MFRTIRPELLDVHLNYFTAAPGPITRHGLPLTAYKATDRLAYAHSTPAEWGYALQAWAVALETGKITPAQAAERFDRALTTIASLQNDPNQSYGGLFYPFYLLLDEAGNERPAPLHNVDTAVPSGDNALLYQALVILEGYLRGQPDATLTALTAQAAAIRTTMDFRPFIVAEGDRLFIAHVVDAATGERGASRWDVYADEGGLVVWVAFASGAITGDEYQAATTAQMRRSSVWTSPCTGKQYQIAESPWFNAMFTWGARSLSGFPVSDYDVPAESRSSYAAASFAPAVDAHLDYGACILGADYSISSDSPSQADVGVGLVGRYTPPNHSGQMTTEPPRHVASHGFFVPLNIGPDLSPETLASLFTIIAQLKNDTAGYYHVADGSPFGFEVTGSPLRNDSEYRGADQGRPVFETLNHAYIVLSLFNGLRLDAGKATFVDYAARDATYRLKLQQALQYLYPTDDDPWCIAGDYRFGSDKLAEERSPYPEQQAITIRADCVKAGSNTILLEAVDPAKAYRWLVWDSLALSSAAGEVIWTLGDNEAPPDYTSVAFDEFDATLPLVVDFKVNEMTTAEFPFQLNDNAMPQVYITFDLTAEQAARDLILDLDTLYATHDDVDYFALRVQVNGQGKTDSWPGPPPPVMPAATGPTPPDKPLILIYAVLDNDLNSEWGDLVNNIELGVRDNVNVRLMVDALGMDDSEPANHLPNALLYDVRADENPLCPNFLDRTCGYVEGENVWRFATENTAHPAALYQFIGDSLLAYPNPQQVILVLVGHGSGWSANVLPAQPSTWRDQDFAGGLLWDDTPGTPDDPETPELEGERTLTLSTRSLGEAVQWSAVQIGRPLDLLYLDACDMAMAEVAHELRGGVSHLLAAPNITWASFNYDKLLPEVKEGRSGQEIGTYWLTAEADLLRNNPGHPHTFSLINLDQMEPVAAAVTALADALRTGLEETRQAVVTAHAGSDRFDSDFDGDLDSVDSHTDLLHFAAQLQDDASLGPEVRAAAQAVVDTVTAAVVAKSHEGGTPWSHLTEVWSWERYGGLSVYLPVAEDEARRRLFYAAGGLAWAVDTTWDEFLAAFWRDDAMARSADQESMTMPICTQTAADCPGLPFYVREVYLPVIQQGLAE